MAQDDMISSQSSTITSFWPWNLPFDLQKLSSKTTMKKSQPCTWLHAHTWASFKKAHNPGGFYWKSESCQSFFSTLLDPKKVRSGSSSFLLLFIPRFIVWIGQSSIPKFQWIAPVLLWQRRTTEWTIHTTSVFT